MPKAEAAGDLQQPVCGGGTDRPSEDMCLGETTSERFRMLKASAPHMKPSWTAMVSYVAAVSERLHSPRS
jgi:hypothetical protein